MGHRSEDLDQNRNLTYSYLHTFKRIKKITQNTLSRIFALHTL